MLHIITLNTVLQVPRGHEKPIHILWRLLDTLSMLSSMGATVLALIGAWWTLDSRIVHTAQGLLLTKTAITACKADFEQWLDRPRDLASPSIPLLWLEQHSFSGAWMAHIRSLALADLELCTFSNGQNKKTKLRNTRKGCRACVDC